VTTYVDASVLLRVVLGEPGRLRDWPRITRPIASVLTRVECLRTIDRARHRFRLDPAEVDVRRAAVMEQLGAFDLIPIDELVLGRAAEPFSTPIGSLDAIHLASAVLARHAIPELAIATHDTELAIAARALGFRVLGTT
jgi:predicted nucleic acid-binding protein